jgi:Ca-activated chloride channel family protein
MECGQSFLGNDPFFGGGGFGGGFGGGGGGGFRRGIDEATLQQIADMTGGTY